MSKQSLRTDDCAEHVIRHYADMVYRLAFSRTGTKHDADEVFQEVFLRYTKKHPVFGEEEHRKAWLIRVTINCSKNLWNTPWRRNTQPLEDDLVLEPQESIDLYSELQKLPPNYREVIHLFYYEDMSIEDISQTLRRKSGTVRAQLTRARAMLKKYMKEEDYV